MKYDTQKRRTLGKIESLGGDDVVFVSALQDYKTYVLSIIYRYNKRSLVLKAIHHTLQIITIVGAVLVTFLIITPGVPKQVPAILSCIVAVASGLAHYYKFREHGRDLRFYAEDMALEYNRFDTKREPYRDLDAEEAQALFMNRIESLFQDQRQRLLALDKLQAEQK